MSDSDWGTPDQTAPAGPEVPGEIPPPRVDPASPAATGVDTSALEESNAKELAALRELILSQNAKIETLTQQANQQVPGSAAVKPDIPEEDHGGCNQCNFLSIKERSNGEDADGTPTPIPAASSALQHVVYALAHAAESHHAAYVKFGEQIFQIARGLA